MLPAAPPWRRQPQPRAPRCFLSLSLPCPAPPLSQNDKDLGFLMSPGEGAVTTLAFFVPTGAYNPTHLLSGSADGAISVWQVRGLLGAGRRWGT